MKLLASLLAVATGVSAHVDLQEMPQAPFDGWRMVKLHQEVKGIWMSPMQLQSLKMQNVGYMDVTEEHLRGELASALTAHTTLSEPAYPGKPSNDATVQSLLRRADKQRLNKYIMRMTEFQNRYYTSETGLEAAKYLLALVQSLTRDTKIVVESIDNAKFDQFNIVARVPGKRPGLAPVIVGAHFDSINSFSLSPKTARAPGYDDDGTGTGTVLELLTMIVERGWQPERPLELHWYAGEEVGLLGSQTVASKYAAEGREVHGMLQIDMTGYKAGGGKMAIIEDFTSPALTDFVESLIGAYSNDDSLRSKCGYACSDHASFTKQGYPAAFVIEAPLTDINPHIHTPRDTEEQVDLDYMYSWLQLATGFAVELTSDVPK